MQHDPNHMDHSAHSLKASTSHDGMQMDMPGMATAFQLTTRIGEVLIPGLTITTPLSYACLCLFTIALCIFKEFLYSYRLTLIRQSKSLTVHRRKSSHASLDLPFDDPDSSHPLIPPPSTASPLTSYLPSLLYSLNTALSYLVMLLIMTYNVGLFVVIVVSTGLAHHYYAQQNNTKQREIMDERGGGGRGPKGLTRRVSAEGRVREGDSEDEEELLNKDCCEK